MSGACCAPLKLALAGGGIHDTVYPAEEAWMEGGRVVKVMCCQSVKVEWEGGGKGPRRG